MPTPHFQKVRELCQRAGQPTPSSFTIPSAEQRVLRSQIMIEEVLETIKGLGVALLIESPNGLVPLRNSDLKFEPIGEVDVVEALDGACDTRVVTTGVFSDFGVDDEVLQDAVDAANLTKFGP